MNPYDPWRLPITIGVILALSTQFYLAQRLARREVSPWMRALIGINVLTVFLLLLVLLVATLFGD